MKDCRTIDRGIIIHQVNCMGVMSTGIALAIRNHWPIVFQEYAALCRGKRPGELLGQCQLIQVGPELYIANVFGQAYYGRTKQQTDYDGQIDGLLSLVEQLDERNLSDLPIHYPKIGCVNAGGDWNITSQIINECLVGLDHHLLE